MGLLLPIALALLALAIPIIIFYMLKLRRRDRSVSSSLLWRRALLDRTANAPWQRLRRNLLLLLQLLLLLLFALGLARPFFTSESPIEGNAVIVMDTSASMGAADMEGGESRWARALEEANRLIDGLGPGSRMSIIAAGPHPAMAAAPTSDRDSLRAALRALQPSNGQGTMSSALTLAAGSARQMGGATVALISDGALIAGETLPVMPGPVLYVPVGGSTRNLGITAFSLRDTPSGPEAFTSIFNSGKVTTTALLSVLVDGVLRDSRRIEVGPGADLGVTLDGLPLDTRQAEAVLEGDVPGGDVLKADDRAWAVRRSVSDGGVLLVTAGNGFLEKALSLLPGLRVSRVLPDAYVPSDEYGLTVLDGALPQQLPAGNLLLFAPTGSPLIAVSGTRELPVVGQVEVNDPLLRFVDLSDLHIASAVRMAVPDWARVLVRTTNGEPLLVAGESEGRRVAAFAFDLHRSDLPLRVAFPILLANLIDWLRPTSQISTHQGVRAGEVITVRLLPEADRIVVTLPGAGNEEVTLRDWSGGEVQFVGTDRLGVYTLRQFAGDRQLGEAESFAVNLFSREESMIAPRGDVGLIGSSPTAAVGEGRPVELWPWVLLGALLLLGLEWWVYNRAGRSLFPTRRERRAAGR
jgi:hypothetical protein